MNKELTNKIRWLCKNTPHGDEWSGIMLYKITNGNFWSDTFEIEGIDFIWMDLGDSVYTNFIADSYFMEELVNKNALEDMSIHQGLLHSHHTMSVNPSGTDDSTMHSMSEDFPMFLTVIVNNKMEMNARVAILTETEERYTVTYKGITGVMETSEYNNSSEKTLFVRKLNFSDNSEPIPVIPEWDTRLTELKSKKAVKKPINGYLGRPPFQDSLKFDPVNNLDKLQASYLFKIWILGNKYTPQSSLRSTLEHVSEVFWALDGEDESKKEKLYLNSFFQTCKKLPYIKGPEEVKVLLGLMKKMVTDFFMAIDTNKDGDLEVATQWVREIMDKINPYNFNSSKKTRKNKIELWNYKKKD